MLLTAAVTADRSSTRFGNEVCELRVRFAFGVAGRASDNLDDFRHGVAVSDRQNVLAPNPVEAFLGHAERDDDVKIVALSTLRRLVKHLLAVWAIVHEVGYFQTVPSGRVTW